MFVMEQKGMTFDPIFMLLLVNNVVQKISLYKLINVFFLLFICIKLVLSF